MKNRLIKILCVVLCIMTVFSCTAYAQVTDIALPVAQSEATLLWSKKLGNSYRDAPSVPVYHDGFIITVSKNTLCKLDAETGKTVDTAETVSSPSFGYTPVLCAEGKIFCPLDGGTVQAFDFETLDSLWVSKDPLGGQALSPISYSDGKLYTGFWNGEDLDGSFVCIDAESGKTVWSNTRKGGYYWAEGYISGKHIVIGGDDGTGGYTSLCELNCFELETGKLTDTEYIIGDQRSGIAESSGKLYFPTKAGYLYRTEIDSNGEFGSIESKTLGGSSTSTPTVYGEKIYLGVQSSGFSGKMLIIDSDSLSILETVDMKGYPQSEVLVSTAHANNQTVYIYSTYNAAQGGLTVIKDKHGTEPAAAELFLPSAESQGYGISTVDVSENGTLYYKNDSGYIFAVGFSEKSEPQISFLETIINAIVTFFKAIISLFTFLI